MAQAKEQLKQQPELFIENTYDLVEDQVDCSVYITNEELDMGAMTDKLIMAANLLPEQDRGVMVRDIYDLLGIPYPRELVYKKNQPEIPQTMAPAMTPEGEVPQVQGQRMV
jgi:hypothetical protein